MKNTEHYFPVHSIEQGSSNWVMYYFNLRKVIENNSPVVRAIYFVVNCDFNTLSAIGVFF